MRRCLEFLKWYNKVLQRYSGSIASMFYGHTHLDDLRVYLDSSQDNKPVLSGKIGAGVTGYHSDYRTNFGYQIVTTDGVRDKSTFGVLNIEARILNLTGVLKYPSRDLDFMKRPKESGEVILTQLRCRADT